MNECPPTIKIFRIPECALCDETEKSLKEFKPLVYDCSKNNKHKKAMAGVKRILGKFFGYPLVVVQYEDIILMISGYYSEILSELKKSIREMR